MRTNIISNPPPIATNINGVLFHPTQSFTQPESSDMDSWKLDWMTKFKETREEHNANIENLKRQKHELEQKMEQKLTERDKEIQKWKRLYEERVNRVIELKAKCEQKNKKKYTSRQTQTVLLTTHASHSTQTDTPATHTSDTQTEESELQTAEINEVDGPVQIDEVLRVEPVPSDTEAATQQIYYSFEVAPTNYQCSKCRKFFNKKSSLTDHMTGTACADEKKLDWQCKVCGKWFTFRGLRVHYSQYIKQKHKPNGKHADVSEEDHKTYLETHLSMKPT